MELLTLKEIRQRAQSGPLEARAHVQVEAAAGVFGIAVHDHLIVGNGRQTSLRREGLL